MLVSVMGVLLLTDVVEPKYRSDMMATATTTTSAPKKKWMQHYYLQGLLAAYASPSSPARGVLCASAAYSTLYFPLVSRFP